MDDKSKEEFEKYLNEMKVYYGNDEGKEYIENIKKEVLREHQKDINRFKTFFTEIKDITNEINIYSVDAIDILNDPVRTSFELDKLVIYANKIQLDFMILNSFFVTFNKTNE